MSRIAVPLTVDDLSPFAKSLRHSLAGHEGVPTHLELLNMLARAAGFANYQHVRADAQAGNRLAAAASLRPPTDLARVSKAARYFDDAGTLHSWPSRYMHQILCLWVFWSRIPAGSGFTEREISEKLKGWHNFGDHALLRRAMIDGKMLSRTIDGRDYRRIDQAPPPELAPLLDHLAARAAAG